MVASEGRRTRNADIFKEAKKEWDPNPWAVCETTVGKKENPEKFERCVKHVKEKQSSEKIAGEDTFAGLTEDLITQPDQAEEFDGLNEDLKRKAREGKEVGLVVGRRFQGGLKDLENL
jgi:hypothetical protein